MLAAALSDLADGAVSRMLRATSKTGRILDPLADKVFVFSVLITLLEAGVFQLWEITLVGLRDLAVLAGAVWIGWTRGWAHLSELRPSLAGKTATAAQFTFMATALLFHRVHPLVLAGAASLSALAAVDYWIRYGRRSMS